MRAVLVRVVVLGVLVAAPAVVPIHGDLLAGEPIVSWQLASTMKIVSSQMTIETNPINFANIDLKWIEAGSLKEVSIFRSKHFEHVALITLSS